MTPDSDSPIDINFLRSWVGRSQTACDVVTLELARKFRATLDLPESPLALGDSAPPLIHFCLAHTVTPTATLASDGHPQKGGLLPPVPLPRRMWAGSSITFGGELHVGAAMQRTSRIAEVDLKNGRSGTLCFVTVEHTIDVEGRVVLKERQDIVYRDTDHNGPKRDPVAADSGTFQRRVEAPVSLLFRYSALTFNSHRIHYDRGYARNIEGYPGLVVHGPLQATLLLNLAAEVHGALPVRFRFRSISPLFDEDVIYMHAREEGAKLKLWTARQNGPVATTAEAEWG